MYHPTVDGGRAFLRKVWRTSRWAAVRRARTDRIQLRSALAFVPVLGVVIARQNALRPVNRLARERLCAAGLTVSPWDETRALVTLYTVVGYVSSVARLRGWLESRLGDGGKAGTSPRRASADETGDGSRA